MATLSVVQRRSLERALVTYQKHLDEGLEYLAGRGIDREAALSVGLGVVRDPIPGHDHLVGRLAIPYLTPSGPVNYNFRCMKDHSCKDAGHGKYIMWSGLSANLFNVSVLESAGQSLAISEGEIDALSSTLAGIPCLGVSGANKWQEHWNNVFEDFTNLYVWQEGDEAGKKFADRVVSEVGAIRVALPDKQDVNSIWTASGAEALRARVRK
jgi:hypothetical protein